MHHSCLRVMAYGKLKVLLLCIMKMAECLRSSAGLLCKQLHLALLQSLPTSPFLCGYVLSATYYILQHCHSAALCTGLANHYAVAHRFTRAKLLR